MQTALDIAILRARCARQTPLAVMARPEPPRQTIKIVEGDKPSQIEVVVAPPKRWADNPRLHKVTRLISAACHHFGIDRETLLLRRNFAPIAYPRQIAMYVANRVAKVSFPDIGRRMGGRDHTTCLYACRKIERLQSDPRIAADCEDLARAIGEAI